MSDKKKKVQYRVRNWREYNKALVQRGSLTLWLEEKTIESWLNRERSGKRGHPYEYSDVAVECMLLLKQVFHLGLRQTQGFMQSIFQLIGQALPVMSYSQLSRRQKDLPVELAETRTRVACGGRRDGVEGIWRGGVENTPTQHQQTTYLG